MCTKERSKSPVHIIACLSPCTTLKLADSEKDFKYLCHKCGCPKKKYYENLNHKHEKTSVCKNREMINMECLSYISKPKDQFQEVGLKIKPNYPQVLKDDRVTSVSPEPLLETVCNYCGHSSLECYGKVKKKEKYACGQRKVEYGLLNDRETKRKPLRKINGCFCEQKGVKCPRYQDSPKVFKNGGKCMCSEIKRIIEKSESWAQTDERVGKPNYSQTEFKDIERLESSTQVELPRSDSSAQTDEKIRLKPAQTQTDGQRKVIISNYSSSEPEKELSVTETSRASTPKRRPRRKRDKSFKVKDKRRRNKRQRSKTNQNEKQTFMIPTIEIDSQSIQRILNINEYQKCNLDFQRSHCSFQSPVQLLIQHPHLCKRNTPAPQNVIQCLNRKETTL